jgi:hypothetical protein
MAKPQDQITKLMAIAANGGAQDAAEPRDDASGEATRQHRHHSRAKPLKPKLQNPKLNPRHAALPAAALQVPFAARSPPTTMFQVSAD